MLEFLQFKRRSLRLPWYHVLLWFTIVPRMVCMPILWIFYRARVYGRHHIPLTGSVFVLCNHQSHFDPVIIGTTLSDRCARSLARETLRTDSKFWGWLIGTAFDSIWLKQGQGDLGAMRVALNELKEGRVMAIFPEGTRSRDGALQPFKRGAFLLIKRGGAPVIPAAIEGAYDAWPKGRSKPHLRARIKVILGEPVPAETLIAMGAEQAMSHMFDLIEGLRLELRARIRTETHGRYPAPGPGDLDARTLDRPKVEL